MYIYARISAVPVTSADIAVLTRDSRIDYTLRKGEELLYACNASTQRACRAGQKNQDKHIRTQFTPVATVIRSRAVRSVCSTVSDGRYARSCTAQFCG